MKNQRAVICYIPTNLDITKLKGYNPRWHDKYHWFIHSIIFKQLTSKDAFGGYVNLTSTLLQKFLGTNYAKQVIDQLINAKVIEYNKAYSVGAFSKSYRLAKRYAKKPIKGVEIKKDTYKRKVIKHRENYLKDVLKENKNARAEFLKLTYARIDVTSAINYIQSKYNVNSPEYKARLIAIDQYNNMHKASFSNGVWSTDFTFKVNKGRIYSPVTMLARDLEQFTYFEGYEEWKSVTMDMPNSQLCFYNLLTTGDTDVLNNIGENTSGDDMNIKNVSGVPTPPIPSPLHTPYVIEIAHPYKWVDFISNGKGYERMMYLTKWKEKESGWTSAERQEFKAEFFGQLFYNQYRDRLTDMEIVFMQHHENEALLLREHKKHYGNKLLAVKVQALEAYFFHTIIVTIMEREFKQVPYTIKHDSITMPSNEAERIYPVLNQLAKEFFSRNEIELKWEEK
jgi:hypothetical protein